MRSVIIKLCIGAAAAVTILGAGAAGRAHAEPSMGDQPPEFIRNDPSSPIVYGSMVTWADRTDGLERTYIPLPEGACNVSVIDMYGGPVIAVDFCDS